LERQAPDSVTLVAVAVVALFVDSGTASTTVYRDSTSDSTRALSPQGRRTAQVRSCVHLEKVSTTVGEGIVIPDSVNLAWVRVGRAP
jgi:hypothetical protein